MEVFFFEARARVQLESLDEAVHGRGVEKADCARGTGFQGGAKERASVAKASSGLVNLLLGRRSERVCATTAEDE